MIVFPKAKINLGLNVLERRSDGFHTIETVMVPIPLCDALEVIVDGTLAEGSISYTRSGLNVHGDPEQDLCMRAARIVLSERTFPGLRMHLHKVIPLGAGLGGGSSDGTQVLLLLNKLLELDLGFDELHRSASSLGSDCPFFLSDRPQWAGGRGEILTPLELDMSGTWLVLVKPPVHVSTADVYKYTVPTGRTQNLEAALTGLPMAEWSGAVVNVMERYVFLAHPEVGEIKDHLLRMGATYASMSGSGSSVFGLFGFPPPEMSWPADYVHWSLRL